MTELFERVARHGHRLWIFLFALATLSDALNAAAPVLERLFLEESVATHDGISMHR